MESGATREMKAELVKSFELVAWLIVGKHRRTDRRTLLEVIKQYYFKKKTWETLKYEVDSKGLENS